MAHFCKLGIGNVVETIEVVSNDIATTEQAGVDLLNTLNKTRNVWTRTSYNTIGGVHTLGGTPFRKNYAGIGFKYDQTRDAFNPPKPYDSWTLNEATCLWDPPVVKPDDGNLYNWNESTTSWDLIDNS